MVANVLEKLHALAVFEDPPVVLGPGELRATVERSGICGSAVQILDAAPAQRQR